MQFTHPTPTTTTHYAVDNSFRRFIRGLFIDTHTHTLCDCVSALFNTPPPSYLRIYHPLRGSGKLGAPSHDSIGVLVLVLVRFCMLLTYIFSLAGRIFVAPRRKKVPRAGKSFLGKWTERERERERVPHRTGGGEFRMLWKRQELLSKNIYSMHTLGGKSHGAGKGWKVEGRERGGIGKAWKSLPCGGEEKNFLPFFMQKAVKRKECRFSFLCKAWETYFVLHRPQEGQHSMDVGSRVVQIAYFKKSF